jgi:hypothetical protein
MIKAAVRGVVLPSRTSFVFLLGLSPLLLLDCPWRRGNKSKIDLINGSEERRPAHVKCGCLILQSIPPPAARSCRPLLSGVPIGHAAPSYLIEHLHPTTACHCSLYHTLLAPTSCRRCCVVFGSLDSQLPRPEQPHDCVASKYRRVAPEATLEHYLASSQRHQNR